MIFSKINYDQEFAAQPELLTLYTEYHITNRLDCLRCMAEAGSTMAKLELYDTLFSYTLSFGEGGETLQRVQAEGIEWLEKAVEEGNAEAMYLLATQHLLYAKRERRNMKEEETTTDSTTDSQTPEQSASPEQQRAYALLCRAAEMGHIKAAWTLWHDPRLAITSEQRLEWMQRYAAKYAGTAHEAAVVSALIEHHFYRAEYAEALRWHAMVESRYEAEGKTFVDHHKYIAVMHYEGLGTPVDYRRAAIYASREVRQLDGYLARAARTLSPDEWHAIATRCYEDICMGQQEHYFLYDRLEEGLFWYNKVGEDGPHDEYGLARALEHAGRYAEAADAYERSLPYLSKARDAAVAKKKMAELRQKLQA